MTRQQALNQILFRLLLVLFLMFASIILLKLFGQNFRVPLFVFLAGNVGGYVGFHRALQNLNDVEMVDLASSWYSMITPSFIGGILAFVLYLLFSAEIITGQLFPAFSPDICEVMPEELDIIGFYHASTAQDYWKLFFWSFVAGFNQKYVFNIIESIKSKN